MRKGRGMELGSGILLDCIRYARWAATTTLKASATLSVEQLHRDLHTTYPSVWATLVHIYQADAVWWSRFQGNHVASLAEFDAGTTLAELSSRWMRVLEALERFAESRTEQDWRDTLQYRNGRGEAFAQPLWEAFLHMVNHSTLHRGQVLVMFRQLDCVPRSMDLIHYYRQRPLRAEKPLGS